jgi:hypothetical protein
MTICLGVVNLFLVLVILPMRSQIRDAEQDLKDLRSTMQTGYMSKVDFKDHLERIEKALDEVKSMLLMNSNVGK